MQEDRINLPQQHLSCAGRKKSRQSLRIVQIAAVLCCLTFAVFLPSLKNGFNWDDDLYIIKNDMITSWSVKNLQKIFSSYSVANYHPLTMLSFFIEYRFFQNHPFGYHTTNLSLHIINVFLVFLLFLALSDSMLVASITAVLFGIHPLRVEAVAWLSARKDLLGAFFLLIALLCYTHYVRASRRKACYFFSLSAFVASLLAKPMALTLPFILFLVDFLTERIRNRKSFMEKLPFFVCSFVFGVIAVKAQYSGGGVQRNIVFDPIQKTAEIGYIIFHYLNKIIIPRGFSCLYPYPTFEQKALSGLCFLAACLGAVLLLRKKPNKRIIFGLVFFLFALIPVLQFVPVSPGIVADRYTYIPAIGLFFIIGEGGRRVLIAKKCGRKVRGAVQIAMILVPAILAVLTWRQCMFWKDGITLWTGVITQYPRSITAYNNRGVLFYAEGEYRKAHADFSQAIRLSPRYEEMRFPLLNLGSLYFDMGRHQEAIATFKRLLGRNPDDAEAYFNLGKIYDNTSRDDEAEACYKQTISLSPSYALAYYNLGCLYAKEDKTQEAVDMFSKTIKVDPDYFAAYVWLAYFYKTTGNTQALTSLYQKAVEQNVQYFEAFYFMASLYSAQGREKEALKLYKKAIAINPDSLEAHVRLGAIYFLSGDISNALRYYNKALALNPAQGVIHNNLAAAYYYKGKHEKALKHCKQALALGYHIAPQLFEKLPQCKE